MGSVAAEPPASPVSPLLPSGEREEPPHSPGPGSSSPPRTARTFGRGFRRLWATFAVSSLGDGFIYSAVPLLAVVVDPRPLAVSAVVATDSLPWLLLALHAGAIADRFERARVMAVANVARGVLLGVMAALVGLREIDYALLVLFVLANAGIRAVYYSASQAAMTELIDATGFNRANGVLYGTEAATENLAGPTLGTMAFAAVRAVPFAADAVAMFLSGLSLLGLRTSQRVRDARRGNLYDGLRHVLGNRKLRLLVYLMASLAGFQGLVSGVLVLVATKDWGVPASGYGAFVAAEAAGIMLGAFLADRLARALGSIWTLLGAAVLSGLDYLVMGAAHDWPLAGAAFVLVGFAIGVGSTIAIALRQKLTPDELMGRVGSAWRGIIWGAAPAGAIAAGGLAVLGGLRLPLYLAGGAQCAVALVLARPLVRRIGRMDGEQARAAEGATAKAS